MFFSVTDSLPNTPAPQSHSTNVTHANGKRAKPSSKKISNNDPIQILEKRGGIENNNLNNFVKQYLENEEEETFPISLYYELDSLVSELQFYKNDFIVVSLNIESLNSKIDKLRELLAILEQKDIFISAIALQETWLSDKSDLSGLFIENFHEPIHQGYICGRKGGLITYVNSNYKVPVKRKNLYKSSTDWEALIVDVSGATLPKKITIFNFYRPPRDNYSNASIQKFLTPFEPIIKKLSSENSVLVVCGDSNINLLRLENWEKCQEYFDLLVSQHLFPSITHPTRFSKHRATLIDHIFCKEKSDMNILKSGIILTKISDHLPCFTVINTKKFKKCPPKFIQVSVNNADAVEKFKTEVISEIAQTHFDRSLLNDPNINYDKLDSILTKCKEKNLPTKKVRFDKYKHKVCDWITYGLMESIKKKDQLYVKLLKTNPRDTRYAEIETELNEYQTIIQTCKRKLKINYYATKFKKREGNIRDTWRGINEVLNRRGKSSDYPTHLIDKGKIIKDDQAIAECFNNFFTNIGPELAKEIKCSSNLSYKSFLKDRINSNFEFCTVNIDDVDEVLRNLKTKKSSGQDGISSTLLKSFEGKITNILTLIINQSLSTGIFPNKLKTAKVVPVFKKDDPHQPGNYRPISLLPAISKVFEKVVYKQVYNYMNANSLLYKSQYGFREKHSTELAAMEVTDKIFQDVDKKKLPLAIFLDFSKAFDTIDHRILLDKLAYYGITGTALNWFRSYLKDRSQFVQYKDKSSCKSTITTGVPQGSILGPLLFIIYINDIAKVTNKFKFTIYADDTTLLEPICTFSPNNNALNSKDIAQNINAELKLIVEWLALNKLSLNVKKTKMMLFHYKQRNVSKVLPMLEINGIPIERVKEFNFLGINLDENMTWKSHVKKVACKIACTVGTMKRLKKFMPLNVMKLIYNSLVVPHITYGLILWGHKIKRINKLQKWAVRTIVNAKYNEHTEPIMKKLKILKIKDIFTLTAIKIFHKYKNSKLPTFFDNMFEALPPSSHTYGLRQRENRFPTASTIAVSQSPRFVIPTTIDKLSEGIKSKLSTHSLQSTVNYVKQTILDQYDECCTIENCYICNRPEPDQTN